MAEQKGTAVSQPQRQHEDRQAGRNSSSGLERSQQRGEQGLDRWGAFPERFASGPFEFMRRMTDEMDRVFDRVFDDFGLGRRSSTPRSLFSARPVARESLWSPRIEAFQKEDKFIVRAELPGLKKEDVEINITDDVITIQGQRRHEQEEQREGFYHSERSYGGFYRTIPLPEGVLTDTADASFRDGVLEIKIQAPPNEVSRGRKLEIKEGSAK
ncbi:MAG: Hsp20/alpha crystallin family protein [Acidobacteria bacterium]|nr:Hsp20/alpha crystallin family protein [Acidobacteriota bacterium]MCA1649546.1 Hsp20/alpha crystallin family protein [Acidobacteriota bacterium]